MSEESHGEEGSRNIRVHLANTSFNTVRFNDHTDVKKVISVVVNRFAGTDLDICHYAIRLLHLPHGPNAPPSDIFWLHRDISMHEVQTRYQTIQSPHEWRYELRVRYLSKNLEEMYRTQRATFYYFYDQVRSDYLDQVAWKIDQETALQLGSLEIRRFCKDMQASALEKKSNLDFLEAEIGFKRFFPDDLIVSIKPKQLRKSIQQNFKKFAQFSESECMFRFLELLSKIARFDIEIFKCSLGTNWSVPVEVVVGPEMGISYVTDKRSSPVSLADFIHVVDIQTQCPQGPTGKALVSFRVSGATEPLNVTCPSLPIAESLADLVDGYHTLMTQNQCSVWSKREYFSDSILPDGSASKSPKLTKRSSRNTIEEEDLDPDYSAPLERGYELNREDVDLDVLLGNGQFGDVYRGRMRTEDGHSMAVAVKACKVDCEDSHGDSFLEEAYIMQQFDHPHIISLIGVCLDSPIWIVMELAEFGELRSYLIKYKDTLETKTLVTFCHQLSMALSYLESKRFVHRDIAARNVLVSARDKVKLSDFGLSRWIEGEYFYTASRGKLPIKWMAPESINFRRFTHASDVWMFGVCMWEILMKGVKPFQGVRNQEVAQKLERGERLAFPPECPPKLFNLLTQTWAFDYTERPTMKEVREQIHQILYEATHSDADSVAETFRRMKKISWDLNGETQPPPKPIRDTDSLKRNKSSNTAETPSQTGTWPRRYSQDNGSEETRKESYTVYKAALEQQRIESEEDNKWLEREEQNMLPNTPTREAANFSQSFSEAQVSDDLPSPPPPVEESLRITVPDNMEVVRDGDEVYAQVLAVVRPITDFSKTVHDMQPESFVEVVKKIGMEVRTLIGMADKLLPQLSSSHQTQVKLSEKLLSADMQKFAESMKRSILYSTTTLDTEYRKGMLADGHVLAVDCKQFLETLDSARLASNLLNLRPKSSSAHSNSSNPSPPSNGDSKS